MYSHVISKLRRNKQRKAAGGDSGGLLCLWGHRGEVAQVVVFAAIGDGFQVFRLTPVGDADT